MQLDALGKQLVYLLVERVALQHAQVFLDHILVMTNRRAGLHLERVLLGCFGDRLLYEGLQQGRGKLGILQQFFADA